jgi:hypothetical protein
VFIDALSRAVAFGRWRAADVRCILAAGAGTPQPTPPGGALVLELPVVPTRSLADYAIPTTATADYAGTASAVEATDATGSRS